MHRTVILHYHLFKNAGTSLDEILQRNFGPRWVTAEFPTNVADNSGEVAGWIERTSEAVAFSTHTALGPVPQIADTRVITVMLLRDPLARIRSAYRFERTQEAETWGAELAKTHDFAGYVRARLGRRGDRQCRNFQTHRLASLVPGDGPELERALAGLDRLTVFGLVEAFDAAMQRLAEVLKEPFPAFRWESVQANRSAARPGSPSVNDPETDALLEEANRDDLALWQAARDRIGQDRAGGLRTG